MAITDMYRRTYLSKSLGILQPELDVEVQGSSEMHVMI